MVWVGPDGATLVIKLPRSQKSSKHLHHGALLVKMKPITKAPVFLESTSGPTIISSDYESAFSRKSGALVIEYLTMATAYFHDDIMCRRKRDGVWRRMSSITTAVAAPSSLMIWTKDSTTWWRCQAPRNSLKHPLKNTLSIIEKLHAPNNAPKRLYTVVWVHSNDKYRQFYRI